MYKYELPSQYVKAFELSCDRQTETTEFIYNAASRVINYLQ